MRNRIQRKSLVGYCTAAVTVGFLTLSAQAQDFEASAEIVIDGGLTAGTTLFGKV